jgi:hypothetical protein
MSLRLCAACSRHVREATCPFCGTTETAALPVPHSRATRAAMVFGAATLVSAAVACGGETTGQDAGTSPTATAAPAYGAPVPTDAAAPDAAPGPDGGPVAAYGAPPPPPDAGAVPPYGAPPPDGGK